jgi:AcrR family transcriptional regulator
MSTIPPARPPQQRRSAQTLERILEAATEVLIADGYDDFTLERVSRRAGVSVGSLYSRVGNRDALLDAVYQRMVDRLDAQADLLLAEASRWQGLTPEQVVGQAIADLAELFLRNSELLRVVISRGMSDARIFGRGASHIRRLASSFEGLLLGHGVALGHEHPAKAVDMCLRMALGTLVQWVTHGPGFSSALTLSDEDMVAELARASVYYLCGWG